SSGGSMADRAINYVLDSGAELFHDQHGDSFIAFQNTLGQREVWPLKSKAASNFIRWTFYRQEGKGLPGESLATARATLAVKAQFLGMRQQLFLRVARANEAYWYDLGQWRAVRVSTDGWQVADQPPALFRHYSHQAPQSEPLPGGSLNGLLGLINLKGPKYRLLLKVYLVAALLGDLPLPILLVYGEQGSAKSFLFKLLRALLDPSSLLTLAPPDSLREFVQLADHHRTVYLDNLSYLPDWLSDALCRLCTGEGFSKRELYTNDDDIVYSFRGLGGITGINLVVTKPDLLDRAIILRLEPIPEERRLTEGELWASFEEMRPYILGSMFDTLAEALRRYSEVKLTRLPRLADFARWGVAIAEALGHTGGEFLEAYGVNMQYQTEAALEESLVAQSILWFLEESTEWEGTATQLLQELESRAEQLHINIKINGWPKGANSLVKRLREVAPNPRRTGVHVREHKSKGVKLWQPGPSIWGKHRPYRPYRHQHSCYS
ncbi:MAG TPA: hypothetical protein VFA32_17230, partial [Dehalococcoidia bacterium]|nr:hypothetical protein [Dehalococcoidia bacterium]